MEHGAPIRYARAQGANLAYQVLGAGPPDVIAIPPMAQNIELMWERPEYRRVLTRTASFARLVHFDKRGTGLSDRTMPVPLLDERVEDTVAVMDAAGIERAFLHGVSEGGPMVVLLAATYPERVAGLILHATSAVLVDRRAESDEERAERWRGYEFWLGTYGTDDTITPALLAPSASESYRAWWPRYERNSATPAAMRDLLELYEHTDVTDLLPRVSVPTLVLHRRDDEIIPVAQAEDLAARIPGARLVVHDGVDHMPHIGEVDGWLHEIERFVTGAEPTRRRHRRRVASAAPVEIRTLGGFAVVRGGVEVPMSEWGSRRARLLCQRLAVAPPGEPVPREHVIDLLWPDDADLARLGARLSVQLSTVRRVLGGGVVADRAAIRLDRRQVQVDLDALFASDESGDLEAVVAQYAGEVLPEAAYEQWVEEIRERARATYVQALRNIAQAADEAGDPSRGLQMAQRLLAVDPYDAPAHLRLIRVQHELGHHVEARRCHARYVERMAELDLRPHEFEESIVAT